MHVPDHLDVVIDLRDGPRATIETPERERIELDGCSAREVEAKVRDFLAWAS